MNRSFEVYGLSTGIITMGDSIADRVVAAANRSVTALRMATFLFLPKLLLLPQKVM